MPILRNVANTDTLENQRKIVNLIAEDLYNYTSGAQTVAVLKTVYADGSLTSPSVAFQSDVSLGIYKDGAQRLGFASGGKPVLSLSPTGSYFAQNLYAEKRSLSTQNVQITNGGSGYLPGTYQGINVIGGTGTSATATVTVGLAGVVDQVNIVNGGYGYVVGDNLTVSPAAISSTPTGTVISLNLTNGGKTYNSGLNIATTGGGGTGLTVDVTASDNGVPTTLGFLNGGQYYTTSQNVSTTGGSGSGLTLDIVASTGGIIGSVGNIISGSNYFSGTYNPTGGSGTGAGVQISVVDDGGIDQITLGATGNSYEAEERPLGGGSGNGATVNITATPRDIVVSFVIINAGSVYNEGTFSDVSTSNVNLSSTGTGLTVNFTVDASGVPSSIVINTPGTNYTDQEEVTIPGSQQVDGDGDPDPDDTRLQLTVDPGGEVTSVAIVQGGTGYTVSDVLSIDGGNNLANVTVSSIFGGVITGVNVLNGGQNYQIGDVLTVPNGTGGEFTVTGVTGGEITSAVINTPGSGYTSNDLITIGSGAATIVITQIVGGTITGVVVNNIGTGYDVGDIITISGVNNVADQAKCVVTATSDGSGFVFNAVGISVTTPIEGNVLTGNLRAVSFTGDDVNAANGYIGYIENNTITTLTSVTTPKLISLYNFNLEVTNDIIINSDRINLIDNNVTTLSIESSNGNLSTNGEVKCLNGLNVNDITTIKNNTIETLLTNPLILKPSAGTNVKIDSNRALIVPSGTQVQRPQIDAETGAIRFNTDTRTFEGYDGSTNVWSSLGSVRDTDGNTYLLAESSVGANDNIFYFYNNGTNTLRVTENALVFQNINSIVSSNGVLKLTNTSLRLNDNVTLTSDKIETLLSGLTIKPFGGTNVVIDSQTSLVIPFGTTAERGSASTGAVRFNTSNHQFEGYGLNAWTSLGGVRDVDGNTYIIPETSAGSNENILYFYNNNANSLQLDQNKLEFRSARTISSINLDNVLQWTAATLFFQNDLVYFGINVYRITADLTSAGVGPTHTTGTTDGYEFIRTIYGNLTFSNITSVNINSVVNVNNQLKITNNDISSLSEDITISPFVGKLVKVNATTSLVLPVGDSSNRGIAESGAVRFNTATTQYEGYNGNAWTSLGGVRDVDGNTFIIPETSAGANENILYFYNDGDNTLRLSKTALTFQTVNTVTSNNNRLNININDVRYSSDTFAINSESATITKLYSGKDNLDIGLKSGLTNDALLRLSATGEIYVNKTFTEGSYTGEKILDRSLTYFGLANSVLESTKFTLVRGTNDFNPYVLYNPLIAVGCKVTIIAVDLLTNHKHMVDYNVIANGVNIYNIEYESLLSGNLLYDAAFDIDSNGDVRLTVTLDNSVVSGSSVEFTILKTFIR